MSDSVPCDMFERILRNLNLCENEQLDKQDKLWKLRAVINQLDKESFKTLFQRGEKIHRRIYDSLLGNSLQ